ncbi:MAG: acyltransferase [Cytophagaceae bacterium]
MMNKIIKLPIYLRSKAIEIELRIRGVKLGIGCRFFKNFNINKLHSKVEIGNFCSFDQYVSFTLNETDTNRENKKLVVIEDKVYINKFTVIDATCNIFIGTNTMIGPNCYITDHDHSFHGKNPDFPVGELPLSGSPVRIEENVWIGSNVVILKGVRIGKNSVIGAGSVVIKDIRENSVAVGNPCKVIKEKS